MIDRSRNNKKGQMLVLAAVSVSALIALVGFGVDLSNLIIRQYQLQRALDTSVLNALTYTETNLNRRMTNEDLVDKTSELMIYSIITNLKMMGIDASPDDLILTPSTSSGSGCSSTSTDNAGVHVYLNGEEVQTGCQGSHDKGCDVPKDITSIKICIVAKLKVKTLLLNFIGIPDVTLQATSCSRRIAAAIVMVLDTSGSMAGTPLEDLKDGAKAFVNEFQEGIDMMSIITFGTQARVLQPIQRIGDIKAHGKEGKEALDKMIDTDVVAGGNTNIAEGIILARQQLESLPPPKDNEPNAFKVIVLFSDGAPNAMTVNWADPRSSTLKDETGRYLDSPFLADNSDLPPTAENEFIRRYPLTSTDIVEHPEWRYNPLSGNLKQRSDIAEAIKARDLDNPKTPWAVDLYVAARASNPPVNPYKSRPDVWSWEPLPQNPLGSNNPTGNAYSYSRGAEYVYTSINTPSDNPNIWQLQLLVPNGNQGTVWNRSDNLPCSSDGYGHLSINWTYGWFIFYVYDHIDCLKEYTYKDSKGFADDVEWLKRNSNSSITSSNALSYGKWLFKAGSNLSWNRYILQEYYHNLIIESDYALEEGITIYAVGLSLKKTPVPTNRTPGSSTGPTNPPVITPISTDTGSGK